MSQQVSYKKQFLLFFMFIIIILIISEVTLRVYDFFNPPCEFSDSPSFNHLSNAEKWQLCLDYSGLKMTMTHKYYTNEPINLNEPNQQTSSFNINSIGFRNDEISLEKSHNTYRIFVLGGSTAFGYVTESDHTTIPGYLEKKLNESIDNSIQIEVINAGIADADTQDELYLLENFLLVYDPDMIILYDGWNDIVHRHRYKANIPFDDFIKNDYFENRFGQNHFSPDGFFSKIDYQTGLRVYKFLYLSFIKQFTNPIEISPPSYGHFTEQIDSSIKNNWINVCDIGKENNFKTVIALQPILGTSDRYMHEYERNYLEGGQEFDRLGVKYLKDFSLESVQLSQSCQYVFDLRNAMENVNEPIYFDNGHMTDFGYEIIANKLNDLIMPIILSEVN